MEKRKIFLDKNFLTGIIVCCFGGWMAVSTGLSRGIYPLAVFLLMLAAGALVLAEALFKKTGSRLARITWKEPAFIALLFFCPVCAKVLGFYSSGYVVIAGTSWLIAPQKTKKAAAGVLLYSLVTVAAAYVIFTVLLKIKTPAGILL